jgi:hypothetical protein
MNDEWLEIQKRHTLNWLIQGAAQHAGMTFHHLVKDELDALDPRLLRLYDEFALLGFLQYWRGLSVLISGWPPRFWKKAASEPTHPFFGHPLLSRYGGMLAEAAKLRALERSRVKGVTVLPFLFFFKARSLVRRLNALEAPHRPKLVQLAKQITSTIWGIPDELLDAELSDRRVLPGDSLRAHNSSGEMLRTCVLGLAGVVQRQGRLIVTGKGTNWQVLTMELVRATAELICLHGLRQLDDVTYRRVLYVTDRIELEPWMLQSGGELWRLLLAALPGDRPIAKVLMHLACLPSETLGSVVTAVIEQSEEAAIRLAKLET